MSTQEIFVSMMANNDAFVAPNMARNEQAAQRDKKDEYFVEASSGNPNMVKWRGNLVGEKEAKCDRE
eukprot:scaffold5974_cov92-Skeletonema_marinoi.AAC.3